MNSFPIVALVCSAGGLEALETVLSPLPADLNAAVLVLQHMAPDQDSALARILQRRTDLNVAFAADGALLTPGHVLITPPGQHTLVNADGTLALIVSGDLPPYRPSADLLLVTLAVHYRARAVVVVLSGKGRDAATGATAVHHFGGTVIAATGATSAHAQMPAATEARDHIVDHVLPVNAVAPLIVMLATTN